MSEEPTNQKGQAWHAGTDHRVQRQTLVCRNFISTCNVNGQLSAKAVWDVWAVCRGQRAVAEPRTRTRRNMQIPRNTSNKKRKTRKTKDWWKRKENLDK